MTQAKGVGVGDDAGLVRSALAGDEAAFVRIVRTYARLVFAVALARVKDADAAEEVAQETFVRAFRSLGQLRDAARLKAWLATIAGSIALDHVRERERRRIVEETMLREKRRAGSEAGTGAGSGGGSGEGPAGEVMDALARLDDLHRVPIALHYIEGRSYDEIAEALAIPKATVRSRIFVGKRRLRERLGHLLVGSGSEGRR